MEWDWPVLLRLVNATGCLVALWFLGTAAHRLRHGWNFKTQQHWWALVGWVTLGFEGTIENIIFGFQVGPRTVLQTLVVAFTLRALTIKDTLRSEPAYPAKKEDSDEA